MIFILSSFDSLRLLRDHDGDATGIWLGGLGIRAQPPSAKLFALSRSQPPNGRACTSGRLKLNLQLGVRVPSVQICILYRIE